jgi:hypothetical protein
MTFIDCKTCGAYWVSDSHRCPPVWRIWCEEDGTAEEDADAVYAHSVETAVEKWADEYDPPNDYTIVRGTPTVVTVRGRRRRIAEGGRDW